VGAPYDRPALRVIDAGRDVFARVFGVPAAVLDGGADRDGAAGDRAAAVRRRLPAAPA
jgi:hypothetical protein